MVEETLDQPVSMLILQLMVELSVVTSMVVLIKMVLVKQLLPVMKVTFK